MIIRPSFTPAFFNPNCFNSISHDRETQQDNPILFSDQKYSAMTMGQFMEHPDFIKCQQEYSALVDRIIEFVKGNADNIVPALFLPTIETIQKDFNELKSHLSDLSEDFFSTHKVIVYGPVKEMFHELENLLGNEEILLQKRMNAVVAIAPHMQFCSGGMVTALQEAISSLKYSTAGIKEAAYRVKIQIIDALILKHVKNTHSYKPEIEVHFVNAYFNHIAKDMGVPERLDPFTSIAKPEISVAQLKKCKQTVLTELNPLILTKAMADEYLDMVKGAQQGDVGLAFEGEKLTDVFNRANDIKKATLDSQFGDVPTENYLLQVPDTLSYQFARQSTLIAKHFMEELKNKQLVNYDDTIRLTAGGENGAIKMLGDLFWRDNMGSCEELKAQELLAVSPKEVLLTLNNDGIDPKEHGVVLQGIAQHILDAHDIENIQNIPDAWLEEFVGLFLGNKISAKEIVPAVMLAAIFNRTNFLKLLMFTKADFNARGPQGFTAAMLAAKNGHAGVLKLLMATKANFNARGPQGFTATMLAAKNGHADVLKLLINARTAIPTQRGDGVFLRVDIEVKNDQGFTAAMLAEQNGHADALKVLKEANALK